jgi:hypothetical protein
VLRNESANLRTNLVKRLGAVYLHKVAELCGLTKKCLPAILKVRYGLFPLTGKEDFRRRVKINYQAGPGIKPRKYPAVHSSLKSQDIAVDTVEREIEQKVPIVQNDVSPRLIAPRQQLSIPFFAYKIDESGDCPDDVPRRRCPPFARRG